MNAWKALARLTVFLSTLVLALFVSRIFIVPPGGGVRVASVPAPPVVRDVAGWQTLKVAPQFIVLHRNERRVYMKLTVGRGQVAEAAPERIWVWAYFFSPDAPGQVWAGNPVEVRAPFAHANHVLLNLTTDCAACVDDRKAIKYNLYARFNVSTESAAAARLPDSLLNYDLSGAAPVVVALE
ncbi:MAG TPA: hypothetical protein VF525_00240 [Pyrinomonadaceae bacterium]|jgi:hypothetical protein